MTTALPMAILTTLIVATPCVFVLLLMARAYNRRLHDVDEEVRRRTEENILALKDSLRVHFGDVMMQWSPLVRKLNEHKAWERFPKGNQPFELARCGEALARLGAEVGAVPQEEYAKGLADPGQRTEY